MTRDPARKETDRLLADMEKRIAKEYEQAEREMEEKLNKYLEDFKRKNENKLKDLDNGVITDKEYKQWWTNQVLVGNRWVEMKDSLARDMHNTNNIAESIVNGYMPEVYALNHNYGAYEVEHASGVDTGYTLYDRQTVERLMRDDPDLLPPPGKKTSERIKAGKDIRWNKQQIQSVMMQSVLQGESMPKIAKRLAEKVGDRNQASAIRNARTMTTGAENAGRIDSCKRAKNMGIDMRQQWIATLDGRTRDSHRDMDGEMVDVGKMFSNGCRYPGDPAGPASEVYNCRCTLIAQLKGFEIELKNYNTSPKLKGMSYEEWKNEHKKQTKTQTNKPVSKPTVPATPKPTDAEIKAQEKARKQAENRFKSKKCPVPADYEKLLQEKYERGTELGKKLFDKYVKYGGQVVDSNYNEPYFHAGQVFLNYNKDMKNKRGAGTTWFHEHGHYIDWFTTRKVAIGTNKAFKDAIIADARALEAERRLQFGGSIGNVRRNISTELKGKGDRTHSIQDLLGGTIEGVYPGAQYCHSEPGYWTTKDPNHLQKEACAHMFEAQFEPDKIKLMEEYFPTAWKMFNEIMGGLVK